MTLNEAKLNFGRRATYTSEDGDNWEDTLVTELGEIRGVWGEHVQFLVGNGHLRFVLPETLELI